mmetsp:Transcript_14753/g.12570  ORF Transcript_14753/g.12570 Transcript_14753/m.12570 type:complete len:401 (-) Transcript_14753:92-1294(-)
MTSSATEVEESTIGKEDDTVTIGEDPSVNLGLNVDLLDSGPVLQTLGVDFVIEMADVTNNSVVLHLGHMVSLNNTLVAGGSDKDVALGNNSVDLDNFETFHTGLEGTDGVNFGDKDGGTSGFHGISATFSDITETADKDLLTSDHDISSSHDTVGEGVSATILVVEFGLGDRVIDVDAWAWEFSGLFKIVKSVDTCGGFLRDTGEFSGQFSESLGVFGDNFLEELEESLLIFRFILGGIGEGSVLFIFLFPFNTVEEKHSSITTIINNSVGALTILEGQGLEGAPPVFITSFTLPGEDLSGVLVSDGSSSLVLGGVDVAGAPSNISTEGFEGFEQDSGLDGNVKRTHKSASLKRLGGTEFFSAGHKTGHFDFGNFDFLSSPLVETDIGNLRLLHLDFVME